MTPRDLKIRTEIILQDEEALNVAVGIVQLAETMFNGMPHDVAQNYVGISAAMPDGKTYQVLVMRPEPGIETPQATVTRLQYELGMLQSKAARMEAALKRIKREANDPGLDRLDESGDEVRNAMHIIASAGLEQA